ncbi:hypothetical protein BGZ65_005738 [Modicella reniformis]|uniref:5'-Nucleotidase C-terminal domain-containing protein n=1 Tax=Modicella reniformis TaxID=1440133 RepID=A0A9P6JHD9_9FUNG|nr:hypothetical protein BGZ65_005738 [Modicella reniformis]
MELAAKTRGLDLIVGGHSHSYLGDPKNPLYQGPYPTVVKNLDGDNTLIVQAYCWGRFIGNLDVSFNPEGKIVAWNGAPIQVEYSLPAEPAVAKLVSGWRSEFESWAKTVLGKASDNFDMAGCRTRDCVMGNFMTDAMLQYARSLSSGKDKKTKHPWADLTIINTGGIRAGLAKGTVTIESIMTASPFGSYIMQIPMKGQELLTTLESVVLGRRNDIGRPVTSFIQVSGLRFSYDSRQRNSTEKPSIKAEIQGRNNMWSAIALDTTYSVVTIDFSSNGGDNVFLKEKRKQNRFGRLDLVLMDFIKKAKIIKPFLDGRIQDISPTPPPLVN